MPSVPIINTTSVLFSISNLFFIESCLVKKTGGFVLVLCVLSGVIVGCKV